MEKNRRGLLYCLTYLVGLLTYTACVFLLVSNYSVVFWIGYGFTIVAFLIQIILVGIFNQLNKEEKFLSISPLLVGNIYLCVELILSFIFMNSMIPYKTELVVQFVLLAVVVVFVVLSVSVKGAVMERDNNIRHMTNTFTTLARDAEYLYQVEEDKEKKAELKKIYEMIRYSDPMSSTEEICKMDNLIVSSFRDINDAISTCTIEDLKGKSKTVLDLLERRSVLCRTSK